MENRSLIKAEEIRARRVETIQHWLQRRLWSPGELRKAVREKWHLDPDEATSLISQARKQLQLAIVRKKDELRCESFQFYRSVVMNDEVPWSDRILAQKQIDKLLGLEAPTTIDVSVTAQTRLDEVPIEVRKRLLEELRRMRDAQSEPINGERLLQS